MAVVLAVAWERIKSNLVHQVFRATVVDVAQALELVRFADEVRSVAIEVVGGAPLVMGAERYYPAEIVLRSDFVNGRIGLQVSREDLDEWERCLDALQAEEGAQWPAGDRSAWVEVVPDDPVEVTVHDSPSTRISVLVPIDVASDWLEENRLRLARVRAVLSASA
ncbi:DUF5959 family protein [Streptomyces sp. AC555_RSS877]|uniref:DUF5959 family protein n=1 Tax=Streptomyces sp. AC555_RSS877 TaxID=2823688 RepID=UPI0027E5B67A|nr:DUF5959 family protein [Streptomyces sp. AC555_RSS877]